MIGVMIHSMRKYISNISIVQKMFLSYLVLLFIPVTISGVFIYSHFIAGLNDQKDSYFTNLISKYTESINSELSNIETLSEKIITNKPIKQFFYYTGSDISKKVEDENNIFAPYLSFITNANRNVYKILFYSYDSDIPIGAYINDAKSVLNQDWYDSIIQLKHNEGIWEGLHNSRSDITSMNQPVFSYYKNIYSQNFFNIIATLQIDILKDQLLLEIENIKMEDTGFAFISNNFEEIIVSSSNSTNEDIRLQKNIMMEMSQKNNHFIHSENGKDFVVYSQKIKRIDLYLTFIVPLAEFTGNINSQRNLFVMIILISLALLILFSYILTIMNSKKLKKVLNGIRLISKGDLTVRIDISGNDELGEIADDLNQMAKQLDNMVNSVYKSNIAQKEAMLAALQSQINPHFLYNTLESIKMMAEIKSEFEISDALDFLGKFMRYNISFSKTEVPLKEEIENVTNYILIHKIRFKQDFDFKILIPEKYHKYRVLKMMLQPIVENAVVYGVNTSRESVGITVGAIVREGIFEIIVKNTGIPIEQTRLDKLLEYINGNNLDEGFSTSGNGVGLKNINERLKLFYGVKYGLTIGNYRDLSSEGVKVSLLMPISKIRFAEVVSNDAHKGCDTNHGE